MTRGSVVAIGLLVYGGLAWLAGYNTAANRPEHVATTVLPAACPGPSPNDPEHCMAWWFGKDYTATHDKENLRRQVCGKR